MFKLAAVLPLLVLAACATTNSFRTENRLNLLKLSPGMTKQQALDVMGVGEFSVCCPVHTVSNPHRTEAYSIGAARFEVLFYYTDKKVDDREPGSMVIRDDELLPIVIKDGKVDGWGWSFWNDTVKRYEIRVR